MRTRTVFEKPLAGCRLIIASYTQRLLNLIHGKSHVDEAVYSILQPTRLLVLFAIIPNDFQKPFDSLLYTLQKNEEEKSIDIKSSHKEK